MHPLHRFPSLITAVFLLPAVSRLKSLLLQADTQRPQPLQRPLSMLTGWFDMIFQKEKPSCFQSVALTFGPA
jgi:hypothetical protein